eukprot:2289919-Pyramimonas_sp.AAC.1
MINECYQRQRCSRFPQARLRVSHATWGVEGCDVFKISHRGQRRAPIAEGEREYTSSNSDRRLSGGMVSKGSDGIRGALAGGGLGPAEPITRPKEGIF